MNSMPINGILKVKVNEYQLLDGTKTTLVQRAVSYTHLTLPTIYSV